MNWFRQFVAALAGRAAVEPDAPCRDADDQCVNEREAAAAWAEVPDHMKNGISLAGAVRALAAAAGPAGDDPGHATVAGVVLRDQTAADLGIGASGDDAYRSGPAGDSRRVIAARCDTCGLDWDRHTQALDERSGDVVTAVDCATAARAGDTAPDDARDNPAWQRLIATTNAQEVARLRSKAAALRNTGNTLADVLDRWFSNEAVEPVELSDALSSWRSAATPADGA